MTSSNLTPGYVYRHSVEPAWSNKITIMIKVEVCRPKIERT